MKTYAFRKYRISTEIIQDAYKTNTETAGERSL